MKHSSLLARAAAATGTLAVAFTGAAVVAPPANAALVETDYGFFASAFGTTARAETLGVGSGRTAFTVISCTRLAGKKRTKSVTAVNTPGDIPTLGLGAVSSTAQTFKEGPNVGSRAISTIAGVRIGAANGLHLVIKGLETQSTAWASKNGNLHTSGSFKLADITANTGIPAVDDELNKVGVTVGDLVNAILAQANDALVIPGVGKISLGEKSPRVTPGMAEMAVVSLRVQLYGANGVAGGNDDVVVIIGRALARIYKHMPAGVMGGIGFGADVKVLGGLVGIDQLGSQILPCQGTRGRILENNVAGVNLGNLNALGVGVARGRSFGVQNNNGSARAWTEGRVADVQLGVGDTAIVLEGVVARANIRKNKKGKVFKSTEGTKVLSLKIGGETFELKNLGKDIEIPGVATIKFGVTEQRARQLKVIAVQIKLVPDAAAETGLVRIDLGVARVRMRRL